MTAQDTFEWLGDNDDELLEWLEARGAAGTGVNFLEEGRVELPGTDGRVVADPNDSIALAKTSLPGDVRFVLISLTDG